MDSTIVGILLSGAQTQMKVLFIGNSFTARNDLPGLLTEMAASAIKPSVVETERVLANGASLRQHWNASVAQEKLEQKRWDYVVLQEQSTLPIKNAKRFHENVRLFDKEIKKHGAQTVLYLTWARKGAPETQLNLTEATMSIAKEIGALVAPVGIAWEVALSTQPSLVLHDKDGSHPSPLGSYLAACVFYALLFGEKPANLEIATRFGSSKSDGLEVQKVAWESVSQ